MLSIRVLIPAVLFAMIAGCSDGTPKDPIVADALGMSVNDWIHDLDKAWQFRAYLRSLPPNQITPQLKDIEKLSESAITAALAHHSECWPYKKSFSEMDGGLARAMAQHSTVNTNHACLDAAGYKRSK